MLKTAIVTPPVPNHIINPFPLLGPSILKTFLDYNGYKIDLVDLAVRTRYLNRFLLRKIFKLELFENRERVINFLENAKDSQIEMEIRKIINLGNLTYYDVIGFSLCDDSGIPFSLCISKILKERYGKKIVFGGNILATSNYTYLLDFEFLDFLIIGDGEEPLLKVLRYFEGIEDIEKCDGIFYKKEEKIHTSKHSTFPIENKPIPSFNVEDLKLYKKLSMKGLSILPYLLTRGCRFKCAFCSDYKNAFFSYIPLEKVISDIRFY